MYCRHGIPLTTHACTQCWRAGAVLHDDAPLYRRSDIRIGVAVAAASSLVVLAGLVCCFIGHLVWP